MERGECGGHEDALDHDCFQPWLKKHEAGGSRIRMLNPEGKIRSRRARW